MNWRDELVDYRKTREELGLGVSSPLLDAVIQLRDVLAKYKHCRHACIDCFCAKDAKELLRRWPTEDDYAKDKSLARPI